MNVLRQRNVTILHALMRRLVTAGFDDVNVARWFGVPLVTDARFVPPPARPRRGLGAWIALLVAGERVERAHLSPAPTDEELAALADDGFIDRDGDALRWRGVVLPWRGLMVASPAAEAFDVSALNVAASLPSLAAAPSLFDVGCGAGLLSLVAARAGARVLASDVDEELVALAARNAALNGLTIEAARGDLLAAAKADDKLGVIVFNAPLLRAPLATADEPARYSAAAGGEALALRFLDGALAHLADDGVILLHAQLTPAVDDALDDVARRARVICVRFAEAPDGTPHALTEIATGRQPRRRDARVPLSVACRHLSREIFAALAADMTSAVKPHTTPDAMTATTLAADATPLPAPWLERRTSERYDAGVRKTLEVTFGGARLDPEELTLLERCNGAPLSALKLSSLDRERLESLVARALVILR